jgi:hypothetical protein
METANPHRQERWSSSFDHKSHDMVMESSFSQAGVELPRKVKRISNKKFVKVKLEKEDIQET